MALTTKINSDKFFEVRGKISELINGGYIKLNTSDHNSDAKKLPQLSGNTLQLQHTYNNYDEWCGIQVTVDGGNGRFLSSVSMLGKVNTGDQILGDKDKFLADEWEKIEATVNDNVIFTVKLDDGQEQGYIKNKPFSQVNITNISSEGYFKLGLRTNQEQTFWMEYVDLEFILCYGFKVTNITEQFSGLEAVSVTGYDENKIYVSGETVELKATPTDGFLLDTSKNIWIINDEEKGKSTTLSLTFADQGFTIKAIYGFRPLTINYTDNYNESFNNVSNPTTTYVNKEVQVKKPEKYGYTFAGWSGEDLTGKPESFIIPRGKRRDLNYVANFTPISGKLTFRFIYQGATGPSGEWFVDKDNIQNFSGGQEQTYNIRTARELQTPKKDGYTFAGWTITGREGFQTRLLDEDFGDLEIIANFTADEKVVTGESNTAGVGVPIIHDLNKILSDENSLQFEYQEGYGYVGLSIKEGSYNENDYKFVCWRRGDGVEYTVNNPYETFQVPDGLSYSNTLNSYTAVFSPILYTIKLEMTDKKKTGIYGDIVIPGKREGIVIKEMPNQGYVIENLRWEDSFKIGVLPYIITNPEIYGLSGKGRYIFEGWTSEQPNDNTGDYPVILNMTINELKGWSKTSIDKSYRLVFNAVSEENCIREKDNGGDKDDAKVLKTLCEKTIEGFSLNHKISSIGDKAFYKCNKLKYAFIPGAQKIGDHVFYDCSGLRTLVISAPMDGYLGNSTDNGPVFKGCDQLNLLILPYNYMALRNLFEEGDGQSEASATKDGKTQSLFRRGLGRIYVPSSLLKKYQGEVNWEYYSDVIFPIDDKFYK